MGSTSFLRFFYPNLLLVFLKKKSSEVGIEPSSTSLLGFQSSRGARKNKKTVTNQPFILSLINPDFEQQ